MTYNYYQCCVGWPSRDVHAPGGLCDMIDGAIGTSRRTFLAKVDKVSMQEMELGFGYALHHKHGLTMSADWHISYHRSKLHGKRVYFFKHSGIEYVFRSH